MNNNEQKIKVSDCQQRVGIFKKVPASELRLKDDFLKFIPKTEQEKVFKEEVTRAIIFGVRDFWRPVCDASFDANGHICYEPGKMPAVGKSYDWWAENAKDFCPERSSRLGTKSEYIAFLATLIKELVASGKSLEWTWNAVCNDSKELGHYWNSNTPRYEFEPTGSREICGWCDLGNVFKILAAGKEDCNVHSVYLAVDLYSRHGFPNLTSIKNDFYSRKGDYYNASGWIVLDSCPD